MDIEKARAHKKTLIPKEGFNVVGIDPQEEPDEALYFISHHKDEGEAKAAIEAQEKKGNVAYLYTPETY